MQTGVLKIRNLESLKRRLYAFLPFNPPSIPPTVFLGDENEQEAAGYWAELLLKSLALDISAHELQAFQIESAESADRPSAVSSYEAAKRILYQHGPEGAPSDEQPESSLQGPPLKETVLRVVEALRGRGCECKNTLTLLSCTGFPCVKNESAQRMFACLDALDTAVLKLRSMEMRRQLSRLHLKHAPTELQHALESAVAGFNAFSSEARALVCELRSFSFAVEAANLRSRRVLFQQFTESISTVNRLSDDIYNLTSPVLQKRVGGALGAAVKEIINSAQDFCVEAVQLIDVLYPHGVFAAEEVPYGVKLTGRPLAGVLSEVDEDHQRFQICVGLSVELNKPSDVFQVSDSAGKRFDHLAAWHNANIHEIANIYPVYLSVAGTEMGEERSDDERELVSRFQAKVLDAVRDNERLIRVMEKHGKAFRKSRREATNVELRKAKRQREALLLLLYPTENTPSGDTRDQPCR